MDEQIKQIAERLRGLRDVLELTAEDIARECDISAEVEVFRYVYFKVFDKVLLCSERGF